jgi:uncharacterized membrane protein
MKMLVVIVAVVLVAGCGKENPRRQRRIETSAAISWGASPTFSWIQANIFKPKCEKCHSGEDASKKIDLSSYDAIMAGPKIITPGNPALSRLFKAVDTGRMPKKANKLSDAEIGAIGSWITSGAKND